MKVRAAGALVVLVAVQLSVLGLYLPPVFKVAAAIVCRPRRSFHCRSTLPCDRVGPSGALVVLVAVQLSVMGLYLPPVFKQSVLPRCRPRRSFRCRSTLPCDDSRPSGALMVLVAVQLSVLGLYLPPVFKAVGNSLIVRPRRSFRCRSTLPCGDLGSRARWWCWWLSNCRCWDCISRRCSNSDVGAVVSAPDDHFAAGPHCRVTSRAEGALVSVVGSPRVIDAATRGISYYRKRVGGVVQIRSNVILSGVEGSVELAMSRVAEFLDFARNDARFAPLLSSPSRRSVSIGLAKHSAITKGSFPRASNSSCKTSGCLV